MRSILQPVAVAAGVSLLGWIGFASPLISPSHNWIYHESGAVASVFACVLLAWVLGWLLLVPLLVMAERGGRLRVAVWSWLILLTPWILLKDAALLQMWTFPHWLSRGLFAVACLLWMGLMVLWRSAFEPYLARAQRVAQAAFVAAGFSALLVIGQICWALREARSVMPSGWMQGSAQAAAPGAFAKRPRRVIWIILDELSYDQVYGRRFPGLELPAFDLLARQATVFTQVRPAAEATEQAVPSLMTGLRVDRIRANGEGMLRGMRDPSTGLWQPFDAEDTVFADARREGFRTGIAGWHNPYCRILSGVLDRCMWVFRQDYELGVSSNATVMANLGSLYRGLLGYVRIDRRKQMQREDLERDAGQHQADYREIVRAGDELLNDPSMGFLLLHIPVPHPGGIYDRRTGSFTTHPASYIDNLALADKYLGHVHEVLEARGEWDAAAVVVMGDHSWRTTLLWEKNPLWTAEDQVASHGGQFDDRPGYIVKLPYQTAGARVDQSFQAPRTRWLLAAIAAGRIRTVGDLEQFAAEDGGCDRVFIPGAGGGRSCRVR